MRKTLTKRQVAASARTAGALSLFHRAAEELEAAASEFDEICQEANVVSRDHADLAGEAEVAAERARENAQALRSLVGER